MISKIKQVKNRKSLNSYLVTADVCNFRLNHDELGRRDTIIMLYQVLNRKEAILQVHREYLGSRVYKVMRVRRL